jgi:hypothetical protein
MSRERSRSRSRPPTRDVLHKLDEGDLFSLSNDAKKIQEISPGACHILPFVREYNNRKIEPAIAFRTDPIGVESDVKMEGTSLPQPESEYDSQAAQVDSQAAQVDTQPWD